MIEGVRQVVSLRVIRRAQVEIERVADEGTAEEGPVRQERNVASARVVALLVEPSSRRLVQ
jgi:hypothetical protein